MNRMYKYVTVAFLLVFAALSVSAQNERHKVEFYGGYSYLRTETGLNEVDEDFGSHLNSHGFNASLTGNVHRYVVLKFDFSTHSKSESGVFDTASGKATFRTNQFLGGVQFKDNRREGRRVRPFAHILAGLANQRLSASGTDGTTTVDFSGSTNNFAMVFGAGIDVKVSKRVDIRIIQVDYNPVFFRDQEFDDFEIPGGRQNNVRFGVGIVIH